MGLTEYEKKRDFKKTAEPKGGKSDNKELRFVVQRHHATALHYDFRLEMDGVLKSWAVPKGPSMNPGDKRLAMMVEDHPYDYRTFEGIIPQGQYGGGVVIVWDEGTYESLAEDPKDNIKNLHAGLKKGDLKFRLHGKILHGEFVLVKLHSDEKSWLLIKHKDDYAIKTKFNSEDFVPDNIKALLNNKEAKVTKLPKHKDAAAIAKSEEKTETKEDPEQEKSPSKKNTKPKTYLPMMAKLETKLYDSDDWFYEHKLDGYRAIGYTGDDIKLLSRNSIDFTKKYQPVSDELKKITREAVLDGEILVEDDKGNSRFQDLQHFGDEPLRGTLKYYVFDLLMLDGHDTRRLELWKRKELLKTLFGSYNLKNVIYHDHTKGGAEMLMQEARKHNWEGIIGKDSSSTYESGKRSANWLKFKIQNSQEAIICGFTKPEGSRHYFGSLILGIKEGSHIRYAGNCGTGFNEATLKDLYQKMQPLVTVERAFEDKVNYHGKVTWVKPELVCEVFYSEWTEGNSMRHPVFKGLRDDKEAGKVTMETPDKQLADDETVKFGGKNLKLTNQNKLWWKTEGITKGQLLHYYMEVAPHMIPYLKDKPLSMRRQPNGIEDEGFFQKDVDPEKLPKWLKVEPLHSDSNDKDIRYIIGQNEATLLFVANWGSIEINPWLSSYKKPDNPDFMVIDLDPHDVPFTEAVEAALKVKELFDKIKLDAYIKTSGSKGLHIYCYVGGKYDYDFIKDFAHYVAQMVNKQLPNTTSIERSPAKRPKKTYIDYLQNRRGQTIAAPYSVRPKPGATVSVPLHWHEVNNDLKISDFDIFNVPERLKKTEDPWKNITSKKADLKAALKLMPKDAAS